MTARHDIYDPLHNQLLMMISFRSAVDRATDRDIREHLIFDYQVAHQVASQGGWHATIEMLGDSQDNL